MRLRPLSRRPQESNLRGVVCLVNFAEEFLNGFFGSLLSMRLMMDLLDTLGYLLTIAGEA